MKKLFNLLFKIILTLVIIVVVGIVALPVIFKDQIKEQALAEVNENLKADIGMGDFDLSLISDFPNFSVELTDLSVVGKDSFALDTLIYVHRLYVEVDLLSVLEGDQYKVEAIEVVDGKLNLLVLESGLANWDIVVEDSLAISENEMEDNVADTGSVFNMALEKFRIENVDVLYSDASLDFVMELKDLNHELSGDIQGDMVALATQTWSDIVRVEYEGVNYISEAKFNLLADLDFDMEQFKFTFKENTLKLNELLFGVNGYFAMPDEGFDMDLALDVKENQFKNFLSMIPAVYAKDFENVEAKGSLALNAHIAGMYTEDKMPAFMLQCKIADAMFKYPDLPAAVENIQLDVFFFSKSMIRQ